MEYSTTYFKDGVEYKTYKKLKNGVVSVLVKKNNSPYQIIKFEKITGTILMDLKRNKNENITE